MLRDQNSVITVLLNPITAATTLVSSLARCSYTASKERSSVAPSVVDDDDERVAQRRVLTVFTWSS